MTPLISRLQRSAEAIDRFSERVGRTIAWLTLAMVLVQFLVVVLRYAFAVGSIALQESITYMHALVFMLGAAYTLKRDGHVRVDIFYRNMRPRAAAWVDLLGTAVFLLPLFGFIIWISWGYVWRSWLNLEGSPEAGGLPLVFALKGIIFVMPLLMLAQGLAMAARSALVILGHGPPPAHHDEVEV